MAPQRGDLLALGHVPKPDRLVTGRAGQGFAVGREGESRNPRSVPDEGPREFTGWNLPKLHRAIGVA